jgi:hypothetical protein
MAKLLFFSFLILARTMTILSDTDKHQHSPKMSPAFVFVAETAVMWIGRTHPLLMCSNVTTAPDAIVQVMRPELPTYTARVV